MLLNAGFHNPPLDGSSLQTETSKEQSQRETEIKTGRPVKFKSKFYAQNRWKEEPMAIGTHKRGVLESSNRHYTFWSMCGNSRKPRHYEMELD